VSAAVGVGLCVVLYALAEHHRRRAARIEGERNKLATTVLDMLGDQAVVEEMRDLNAETINHLQRAQAVTEGAAKPFVRRSH